MVKRLTALLFCALFVTSSALAVAEGVKSEGESLGRPAAYNRQGLGYENNLTYQGTGYGPGYESNLPYQQGAGYANNQASAENSDLNKRTPYRNSGAYYLNNPTYARNYAGNRYQNNPTYQRDGYRSNRTYQGEGSLSSHNQGVISK